jgi:alpha-tubulin suppressor-like RCC1 family protein
MASHLTFIAWDGSLVVWGSNEYGQLGLGDQRERSKPRKVKLGEEVVDFAAGYQHSVAITKSGAVYSWGRSHCGQLGLGNTTDRSKPTQITFPKLGRGRISKVTCGEFFSTAVTDSGQPYIWGCEMARTKKRIWTNVETPEPTKMFAKNPAIVACGGFHLLTLSDTGVIGGWGRNQKFHMGPACDNFISAPDTIEFTRLTQIAAGSDFTLALDDFGNLTSWGSNDFGQLGRNTKNYSVMTEVEHIACGAYHSLVLTKSGSVYAWGLNSYGQVGGETRTSRKPQKVKFPKGVRIVSIGCGAYHSFAVSKTGRLFLWGDGTQGKLGVPSKADRVTKPKELKAMRVRPYFMKDALEKFLAVRSAIFSKDSEARILNLDIHRILFSLLFELHLQDFPS